jgi:Ulp1 family protease
MFHPKEWLGDAVINFCLKLLADEFPKRKCAFKDTNFFKSRTCELNGKVEYKKLTRRGVQQEFDVLQCEKIFVPINIRNSHW